MKAFFVKTPGDYGLIDVATPDPGPGQALLRVAGCGICGSDLDVLEGTRPATVTRYPAILGHEFSAEVVGLGPGVTKVAVGDKVAVDTLVCCGSCFNCQQGWVCHCSAGYGQLGFTHPGGMAEFLVANETQLYKVGAEADLTAIALAEPTSCAAHGVLKAEIKPGDHVVICGAGPIGVLAMQVARLFSPQTLILVEVDPLKLAAATQWGATHAVDAKAGDVAERIREITQGRGADAVIECSGNLAALQASFQYAGTKGRIAAIGVPSQMRIETDFLAMLINDLTFRASNGYTTAVWTWVLKLLAGGKIDHQRIITHKLPLEQVDRGLKLLQDRTEMVVKVMLHASN